MTPENEPGTDNLAPVWCSRWLCVNGSQEPGRPSHRPWRNAGPLEQLRAALAQRLLDCPRYLDDVEVIRPLQCSLSFAGIRADFRTTQCDQQLAQGLTFAAREEHGATGEHEYPEVCATAWAALLAEEFRGSRPQGCSASRTSSARPRRCHRDTSVSER